jgi:hypothetical protein
MEIEEKKITPTSHNDIFEALKKDISERLKWFKNQEEEFCILDRITTFYFFNVFRDALYQYDPNAILCERLFLKEACKSVKVPVTKLTDTQREIVSDFLEFSNNIPKVEDLTKEQQTEITNKLNEYQNKIEIEVRPVKEERDAWIFDDASTGINYTVTPLKNIPDETLEYVATIIANFVISYFQTMSYSITVQNLELRGVSNTGYIDIVAVIK